MIHRRGFMTLSMALVIASGGMLAAEDAKPGARSIPLRQQSPGYQELLSGPPASVHMKSGLVALAPGKSVGKHSTEDHEEMVVVLSGRGQMVLANGSKIDISPEVAAYSPPGSEHKVINTGS